MQCPICSATFAEPQALEQHVYRCLDAQEEQDRAAQLSKDEELARQLHLEQERSVRTSSDHSSSSRSRAPRCNLQPADFASSASSDLWMSFNLPSRSTKIRANPFPGKPQSSLISKLVVDETQTLLYKCGMKEDLMDLLEERHQLGDLALLYKNTVHGNSVSTLYSCVDNDWPLVILIEDSNHCVFGCFLSHPLKSQGKKATGFKGTGETFLFTLLPECTAYRWSGINGYYVLMGNDSISLGCGGSGGYGLRVGIDGDVTHGSTSPCDTFLNPILAGSEYFECITVEVWRLQASL